MIKTDVVIIGAGPVGLFAIHQLGIKGLKSEVIDNLDKAGGQCIELYPDKPIYDIPAVSECSGKSLTENLLKQIFDYRFEQGKGLKGHSLGNLLITAMSDITGSFEGGLDLSAKILGAKGKVLPSSLENITLEAILEDGTKVVGESLIPLKKGKINEINLIPKNARGTQSAKDALNQSDINPRGHSIECRINAENPANNFQPSPGIIKVCHQPSGFRTRVDGSVFQGCKITPYYDSLIAKVICKGRNRTEAIQRTLRSLDEFVLEGITTTIGLHKKILGHKKFIESNFDTNWLAKEKFF